MPDYDTSLRPPAPVAEVEVRIGDGAASVVVPMLIDSGSDVTVVPLFAVQRVGAALRPYDLPLQAYTGDLVYRDVAHLVMKLLRFTFRGDYMVDDIAMGVLGRNVLNHLVVTLDGPGLAWSASPASSG